MKPHIINFVSFLFLFDWVGVLWRLKALNRHSITHMMYIEMEMLSSNKKDVGETVTALRAAFRSVLEPGVEREN